MAPPPAGHEPDARYTFANERTFLAWIRTALALVAAGLAVIQLLPPFHGIRWGRHAIGIPLIVLGALIAVLSYRDWMANQRAMRRDKTGSRNTIAVEEDAISARCRQDRAVPDFGEAETVIGMPDVVQAAIEPRSPRFDQLFPILILLAAHVIF